MVIDGLGPWPKTGNHYSIKGLSFSFISDMCLLRDCHFGVNWLFELCLHSVMKIEAPYVDSGGQGSIN